MPVPPGHPTDRRSRIVLLKVLRVVFSAAAIGLIVFGLFTMREASRSRGWARTGGRVIASKVNEFTGRSGTTWRPMVIYSYSVGGVRFMSSRIAFHPTASGYRGGAAALAARYPAGAAVSVFYDPQSPEQAVLEPGRNPWAFIIAGGVFSMLVVWMRIRQARADRHVAPNR